MKKLICAKDVETFNQTGEKLFFIEDNTIITPSAQDLAKAFGIEFSTKPPTPAPVTPVPTPANSCESNPTISNDINSDMIYAALKMLLDKGALNGILPSEKKLPYDCETDASGLKLVRGSTVQMDTFDTGTPSNKVFYQELISKNDSKMSAGFLLIDHSTFDWELKYEEIDYVIEGTLMVTINGHQFTANAGDVLFVPSGSNVVWSSPNKARIFYATYPANWADL